MHTGLDTDYASVVSNFRKLQHNDVGKENARRIGAKRTAAQRLAAIDDLAACMAHFTVAQRMHIYMLYEEAVIEESRRGAFRTEGDPFVIESGLPAVRPRGNPNNRKPAGVGRSMAADGQSETRAKRMRRVGCRLSMLVRKFGRGILALLDEGLSQNM